MSETNLILPEHWIEISFVAKRLYFPHFSDEFRLQIFFSEMLYQVLPWYFAYTTIGQHLPYFVAGNKMLATTEKVYGLFDFRRTRAAGRWFDCFHHRFQLIEVLHLNHRVTITRDQLKSVLVYTRPNPHGHCTNVLCLLENESDFFYCKQKNYSQYNILQFARSQQLKKIIWNVIKVPVQNLY